MSLVGKTKNGALRATPLSFAAVGSFDMLSKDPVAAARLRKALDSDQRAQLVLKVGNSVVHVAADQMDPPTLTADETEVSVQLKPEEARALRGQQVPVLATNLKGRVLYYKLSTRLMLGSSPREPEVGVGRVFSLEREAQNH